MYKTSRGSFSNLDLTMPASNGDQEELFGEKNRVQKSRETVPLKQGWWVNSAIDFASEFRKNLEGMASADHIDMYREHNYLLHR